MKREAKNKGEKERYKHLNAEFQRIARRDKKALLSDQCKELEENIEWKRLESSSRKLEIPREHFQRRQWHCNPVLLPGKSHGQRSLVGCSPWGHEESDQLSDLTFTFHFHALEKEMATRSSVLAWRIPGIVELDGLPSIGSRRVGHD